MQIAIRTLSTPMHLVATAALLLCSLAASAATPAQTSRERQRLYEAQRQLCLKGQSGQSRADCMKEARALQRENPANLTQPSESEMDDNARKRCEGLQGMDRQSCMDRIQEQDPMAGGMQGQNMQGGSGNPQGSGN